ncbi:hypothetical protein MSWHS_1768 [Methanosarcina sp. WWM596]|nr:hypothetical protein MSWHS_1768 [Methanosarcina sp. WWM596]
MLFSVNFSDLIFSYFHLFACVSASCGGTSIRTNSTGAPEETASIWIACSRYEPGLPVRFSDYLQRAHLQKCK